MADLRISAVVGLVSGLPLVALLYLGRQLAGLPFLPFVLFDWLARSLPGSTVTFFIDTLVKLIGVLPLGATSQAAKSIEQFLAIVIASSICALFGISISWLSRVTRLSCWVIGAIGGFIFSFLAVAVTLTVSAREITMGTLTIWPVLIIAWGSASGALVDRLRASATAERIQRGEYRRDRRAFLIKVLQGSVALALGAFGLGKLVVLSRAKDGATDLPLPESVTSPPPPLAPNEFVPGIRPLVTPNKSFYRVDINLDPPVVDTAGWQLQIKGLFARPRPLSIQDLTSFPAVTEPITLSCISNPVGGDLIGTAFWTGLRLRDLLANVGLLPDATELYVEAYDGFFETVSMADMLDQRTLLIYGMNGAGLPIDHGFPLRILIPNRYGMKQPKWIILIEATNRHKDGYWVQRGWSREARPQILSMIDIVAKDQAVDGILPVGGIAWAGDRGISAVEVQVDNGPWNAATLLPQLGPLAWTGWRFDWPRSRGVHRFRVRATDGSGTRQVEQVTDPHPDGATGLSELRVNI